MGRNMSQKLFFFSLGAVNEVYDFINERNSRRNLKIVVDTTMEKVVLKHSLQAMRKRA
jgi:hypothetical protein